jgi:hypothetical protein
LFESVVKIHLEWDVEGNLFQDLGVVFVVVTFTYVIIKIFKKPLQLFILIMIKLVLIIKIKQFD